MDQGDHGRQPERHALEANPQVEDDQHPTGHQGVGRLPAGAVGHGPADVAGPAKYGSPADLFPQLVPTPSVCGGDSLVFKIQVEYDAMSPSV